MQKEIIDAVLEKLISIIHKLTDSGNTVVFIDHEMNLIKQADYIIDLGPEGGEKGGHIVIEGTPEKVSKEKKGYTAEYLYQSIYS